MKLNVLKVIGIIVIVLGFISLGMFFWNDQQELFSGKYPPPLNSDIAYKHIVGEQYRVYDTAGHCYWVTEQKFDEYSVPQKIADNLYRLPNGELLTCLVK